MYDIKEENTKEALLECVRLGELHYNEVEEKSSALPYKMNTPFLLTLLDTDMFSLVTARKDGKIVGYYCNLISPDILTESIAAKEIGIYVAKEVRNTRLFFKMFKFTEKLLISKGADQIQIMFKKGHNEQIPAKLGYELTECIYQKIVRS